MKAHRESVTEDGTVSPEGKGSGSLLAVVSDLCAVCCVGDLLQDLMELIQLCQSFVLILNFLILLPLLHLCM